MVTLMMNPKRKNYWLTTAAAMVFSFSLLAQSASVKGKIQSSDSTQNLSGVSVYLDGTNHGTISNGSGHFRLEEIPVGDYTLVISSIGYSPQRIAVQLSEGDVLTHRAFLEEWVNTLDAVNIISKGVTGIKDAPGSMHVLTPRVIEKFSYTDINRTLRSIPGINLQEEDGFGLRPNIGLRGTGVERSSKITVMEDGVLMAPAPYAAPAAYYFPTIGRMQGIEVLKGSSQIKYGPYTTGGAINLISTQIPSEFGGRIHMIGGSFGGRNLHAYVGNSHKNVSYLVETFQFGSEGFKKLDGGGNTGFSKQDYLAKVRVNTNADAKYYQSLTFKVGQSAESSNETYLGLSESDFSANPLRRYAASQIDHMATTQHQYSISHSIRFPKVAELTTTAYRSDFSRNWYKLDKVVDSSGAKTSISSILDDPNSYANAFAILNGGSSLNSNALHVKANNRDYYAQGIQTNLSLDFKTGKLSHKADIGVRVHQDQIDRFQWVDEYAMVNNVMLKSSAGTPGTESNRVETANAIASYIQYRIKYRKFTFTPGLRYENIHLKRLDYGKSDPDRTESNLSNRSNWVQALIPGAAIDYQHSKFFSAFVGVHQGFAPAGSKDGAEPEQSVNYEAGIRYAKNALSGQVVYFINDYENLLGADLNAAGGAGSGNLFNGGQAITQGVEFQASQDLIWKNEDSKYSLPLSVVYTFTEGHFENDFSSDFEGWGSVAAGDHLPYLANHQFSVILGIEHHKFSANVSGRFVDEMRTNPGQGAIPSNEKTDAYFVLDASASYNLHKYISLFGNMTNISDETYVVARRPAGLRPGMPRAFNLGLKVNF